MDYQSLVQLAKQKASEHGLDPTLICAIVEQESDWNQWAMRFEPAFERRYIKPALPQSPTTEEMAKAVSFGLMQIMGEVARELGFGEKYLTELCDPFINLEYGCKHFANKLQNADGDTRMALLHWNGGGNLQYPDQVLARQRKYA
jgi:soluble lytic murein transglycosylase-like protein